MTFRISPAHPISLLLFCACFAELLLNYESELILMDVPEIRPGESVHEYITRVQRALGTDYVYVLYGPEVLGPIRGEVNYDVAENVVRIGRILSERMPEGLNTVIGLSEDGQNQIVLKRLGESAYLLAMVPRKRKDDVRMVFEELVV